MSFRPIGLFAHLEASIIFLKFENHFRIEDLFCPSNDHRKSVDVPHPLNGVGGVRNF